jgi:hypothetical protein
MYKNFRVGVVKYYDKGVNGKPDHILVEAIESCNGSDGVYFSSYNLLLEVDRKFAPDLTLASVGRWILFGFYIQSFFDNDANKFVTTLKLRHYEELDSKDVFRLRILDSRIKNQEGAREVIAPTVACDVMYDIMNKTKYN